MIRNISYVFPNVATFNRNGRGGLQKRYETGQAADCIFIEVPADFIKNKTEVKLTGKELGAILNSDDINNLYDFGSKIESVKYILHTEPSFSRSNGNTSCMTPPLLWNNMEWVDNFTKMIIEISKKFRMSPAVIEIHPGSRNNTNEDLIRAIITIRAQFEEKFRMPPVIVVENRTGQFISDGNQISDFWEALLHSGRLCDVAGIVLDIQQLYTVTKKDFLDQLNIVPKNAVKGLHIHCRHRTPSIENEIPWEGVFSWIKEIKHNIFINPEVHHLSQAKDTISFCKEMLR